MPNLYIRVHVFHESFKMISSIVMLKYIKMLYHLMIYIEVYNLSFNTNIDIGLHQLTKLMKKNNLKYWKILQILLKSHILLSTI